MRRGSETPDGLPSLIDTLASEISIDGSEIGRIGPCRSASCSCRLTSRARFQPFSSRSNLKDRLIDLDLLDVQPLRDQREDVVIELDALHRDHTFAGDIDRDVGRDRRRTAGCRRDRRSSARRSDTVWTRERCSVAASRETTASATRSARAPGRRSSTCRRMSRPGEPGEWRACKARDPLLFLWSSVLFRGFRRPGQC